MAERKTTLPKSHIDLTKKGQGAHLADVLSALAMVQGAHTGGHFRQADNEGVPISLDVKGLAENWQTPDTSKASRIHNAGFEFQDIIKQTVNSRPYDIANALYKFGYLADIPKAIGAKTKGDINLIGRTKGKDAKTVAQLSLALSAIADMHRAVSPGRKWDLNFWQSSTGTPGLAYSRRF